MALETLNPRQREAACFGVAPLLIFAGAGTGKTNTLAHRVAHLVLQKVPAERILLLTFTRRAALEMTRRAQRIAGEVVKEVRLPWSGTFHSIANRLIRRHCKRVGLDPSFSVLDRGDAADLMDVVRHERGLSRAEKRFPRKDTCLAIYSHRVNTQRALAETLQALFPWCAEWEAELTGLFRDYVERKLANQALDYDDLLLYWHAMMADAALAREIDAQFDHILVDEYQDTNVLQAEILQWLRPSGEGLTVVGDDAQAIYSFRAATVANIRGFPAQFNAAVVALEENYRSTQAVLDAANALIGKNLRSRKKNGAKPRYVTVADDAAQAQYVVTQVLQRASAAFRALQLLPGIGPSSAGRIFTRFVAEGFSFRSLDTGVAEFDQLMSALGDPQNPWPGQVGRVREWYEPHLERIHDAAQVRAGDLLQLERISTSFETRERFLTEMALDPPQATGDLSGAPYLDEDYLVLSTVHSAKGQEWEAVHLLNVADGNFPSEFSTGRPELIDEERRLLYVAMTRAKSELHLLAPLKYYVAQQSRLGDKHVYGAKSRFLTDAVMACLEPLAWGDSYAKESFYAAKQGVDVAAKLRGMWSS